MDQPVLVASRETYGTPNAATGGSPSSGKETTQYLRVTPLRWPCHCYGNSGTKVRAPSS